MPLRELGAGFCGSWFEHVHLGLREIDNFVPVLLFVEKMRKFALGDQVVQSNCFRKIGELELAKVEGVPGVHVELGVLQVQNLSPPVNGLRFQVMVVHILQDEVAVISSEVVGNDCETFVLLLEQPESNVRVIYPHQLKRDKKTQVNFSLFEKKINCV